MLYTVFEFYRLTKSAGSIPLTIWGLLTSLYTFISFYLYRFQDLNEKVLIGIIPMILLTPVFDIVLRKKNSIKNILYTLIGVAYIALPFSFLNLIAGTGEGFNSGMLLFMFSVLWANDSGAYLVGSWIGKHKLVEKISPNKTWEGAIGGAIIGLVVALVLSHVFGLLNYPQTIILAMLIIISGIFGDLTESLIKRNFEVKDSGKIMPGHGGFLDRFDSMLFAAPICYFYISIFIN